MRKLVALMIALLLGGWALAQTAVPVPAPPPAPPPTPAETLYLDLSTGGKVAIQLRPDVAPKHVARIKELTRRGFYDKLGFHRVIEGFMAQGGDPLGTGQGGSDLPDLPAEFNGLPHVRGAVSMARAASPDSANSQFFIMFAPRTSLDGKYTVFGRVIGGMQYVDAITRGEGESGEVTGERSYIVKATIASDLGASAASSLIPVSAPMVAVPIPPQPLVPAPRAAVVKRKPAPER